MEENRLNMMAWALIVLFAGIIFALSLVHTVTGNAQMTTANLQAQQYEAQSVKELITAKNNYVSQEPLLFFRRSNYGDNSQVQVYAFRKEDMLVYVDKIKKERGVDKELFIVISASREEKENLTVTDQITNQEIPLLKYLEDNAYYTGARLTDNFCPGFTLDPNVVYHLYDCKDWGCRIEEIR